MKKTAALILCVLLLLFAAAAQANGESSLRAVAADALSRAAALPDRFPAWLRDGLRLCAPDAVEGYADITLICRTCGKPFVFTAEQQFYDEHGFQNGPTRCADCRAASRNSTQATKAPRVSYTAQCASCGKEITLPFMPSGDRPVYCNDCFQAQRP